MAFTQYAMGAGAAIRGRDEVLWTPVDTTFMPSPYKTVSEDLKASTIVKLGPTSITSVPDKSDATMGVTNDQGPGELIGGMKAAKHLDVSL